MKTATRRIGGRLWECSCYLYVLAAFLLTVEKECDFQSMKLRESGRPEEEYWESLFDVELILDRLGIVYLPGDVIEIGSGYGTFTLPVAKRVSGILRTFDIETEMVARTQERAKAEGISNIYCEVRDVFEHGFGVPSESQVACLLFNILHCEVPVRLLKEAARALRPTGSVFVIHWRYDHSTPRGPRMEIRPRPEQIRTWAETCDLRSSTDGAINLPPYHFGLFFGKG